MSFTSTEIASQATTWARALEDVDRARPFFGLPGERVLFLGCGTSAVMGESLAILREQAGHGETDAAYASEWRPGRHYDRVIALTRSGTSSEVLEALRSVPPGMHRSAITGVTGEAVDALVDDTFTLGYANEDSIVQTRFPTTTLVLGRAVYGEDVSGLPAAVQSALDGDLPVAARDFDHFVYLGTGWRYGLAQEAALKIREAAQAWSESYPSLDYRHGPIAVAHPGTLVWMLGDADRRLAADIEATGAHVHMSDEDPLIQLVQAQRLAVDLAVSRGLDPDAPRALSRSVVLEPPLEAV